MNEHHGVNRKEWMEKKTKIKTLDTERRENIDALYIYKIIIDGDGGEVDVLGTLFCKVLLWFS